ncbi:MAG: MFS transporter, partial [Anaerolineae bacterium]|nr:MFS transporter [Anaerolineae bacterium]
GEGIGALITDLQAGIWTRRFGSKRVMQAGIALSAISTLALWGATSIPQVVVYRIMAGSAQALFGVARHAYIADRVTLARRGRAIAILGGVFRIGSFIGPTLGGMIAGAMGLRAPFPVYFAISVIAFAIVTRAIQGIDSEKPKIKRKRGVLWASLRGHWGPLIAAGSAQLMGQMVRVGRAVLVPLYAAKVLDLEVAQIGVIVGTAAAMEVAVFYFAGVIMDRWGRKWAIVPSFVIQSLAVALIPLAGSFADLLVIASIGTLANGFSSGAMMTLGADLAPKEARGEFLGLWRLIGDTGGTIAPLVVGAVADVLVIGTSALVIAGAGLSAALIFARMVPETLVNAGESVDQSPAKSPGESAASQYAQPAPGD